MRTCSRAGAEIDSRPSTVASLLYRRCWSSLVDTFYPRTLQPCNLELRLSPLPLLSHSLPPMLLSPTLLTSMPQTPPTLLVLSPFQQSVPYGWVQRRKAITRCLTIRMLQHSRLGWVWQWGCPAPWISVHTTFCSTDALLWLCWSLRREQCSFTSSRWSWACSCPGVGSYLLFSLWFWRSSILRVGPLHGVSGHFRSFFVEPPCTTFSPAAYPSVRSYENPVGYDRLCPKTYVGNLLAFRSLLLLRYGCRHKTFWSLQYWGVMVDDLLAFWNLATIPWWTFVLAEKSSVTFAWLQAWD